MLSNIEKNSMYADEMSTYICMVSTGLVFFPAWYKKRLSNIKCTLKASLKMVSVREVKRSGWEVNAREENAREVVT